MISPDEPATLSRAARYAVLAAAFGGLVFDGIELGLMPVASLSVAKSLQGDAFTDAEGGKWFAWFAAALMLGAAIGGSFLGNLGDRIGRAKAMGVSILFYRDQDEHRKLITSTNQLVKSGNGRWRVATRGRTEVGVGEERLSVKTTEFTDSGDRIVAWYWYRVGGRLTASDILATVYIALSKLSGRGDDSALVVIYTRKKDRSGSENLVLGKFVADMGDAVQRTLSDAEAR